MQNYNNTKVMIKSTIFWDMTPCRDEEITDFLAICFQNSFLLGLLFEPEDGGDIFIRNVGSLSTDKTECYSR
jgi:hypothetical protein